MMRLRAITLALVLFAPLAAEAQPPKLARIGVLCPITCAGSNLDAFKHALRAAGYVEGRTITFDHRAAEGRLERLSELAEELVRLNPDLIFTSWGTASALAAKRATRTIPIVAAAVGDPVAAGLAASLARPGQNVTGLSSFALELEGKRLELLREFFPKISRVAVLWHPAYPYSSLAFKQEENAARALGLRLYPFRVREAADIDDAFNSMQRARVDALSIHAYLPVLLHQTRITELAARHRIYAIYPLREYVEAGGLISYGAAFPEIFRRAAGYVDKILKGASPANLPIEQPTRFELVINLTTAKALGFTIPPSLLLRADQLIE